jgi:hypothetical protein
MAVSFDRQSQHGIPGLPIREKKPPKTAVLKEKSLPEQGF